MYDIIELEDRSYLVVCGGESFKIEFDNETKKSMFYSLLTTKEKNYKSLVKTFIKNNDKFTVYSFFEELKSSGLFYFDGFENMEKGMFFESNHDQINERQLENKKIGLIGSNKSNIVHFLQQSDLSKNILFFDVESLNQEMTSFIQDKDVIIFDASIYNPNIVMRFNDVATKENVPWLYVSGVRNGKGFFGPLFYEKQTGCYECLIKRLKSNMPYLEEYTAYEKNLIENNKFSKNGRHDKSFDQILSSLIVLETKKILLDFGFPHSYGNLICFDFDKYQTELHPLYKVPFCQVCYEEVELSRAPWLDSIIEYPLSIIIQ